MGGMVKAACILGVAVLAGQAWFYLFPAGADADALKLAGHLAPVALAGLALLALYEARGSVQAFTKESETWKYMLYGIALWFLGETARAVQELALGGAAFPSVADALMLAGYPFVFTAVSLALVSTVSKPEKLALILGVVLTCTILVGGTVRVATYNYADGDFTERVLGLAYSFLDTGLFVSALAVALVVLLNLRFMGGTIHALPFVLLAIGFMAHAAYNVALNLLVAAAAYYPGHSVELFYSVGYVFFALAACALEYSTGLSQRISEQLVSKARQ